MLTDAEIINQNPWWFDKTAWTISDPHLNTLSQQSKQLPIPLVESADFHSTGIHTIRGPRQTGKSTALKLLIQRCLQEEVQPRNVIYLAFDLLEGQPHRSISETIQRAQQLARGSTINPGLLFLDEITLIDHWQTAIKYLWDQGPLRNVLVYCTGSSAIDLQHGTADRLPKRRGNGHDHLVLPQNFASFASATNSTVAASPQLTLAQITTEDGRATIHDNQLFLPQLDQALERYCLFGGLPKAVSEAAAGEHVPSAQTKRIIWDSLLREVQYKGASTTAARGLMERVVRSLGSKISWSSLAREMGDIPLKHSARNNHHTVRDYIEYLASGYLLFILYYWQKNASLTAQTRDKKLYFVDPLLYTVTLDHMVGFQPNTPALLENIVGMNLLRRYEPSERLIESFTLPETVHIWQTTSGKEIDFVCGLRRESLDICEVKYQTDVQRSIGANIAKAQPGRPIIVATKTTLRLEKNYSLIPASLLLWALG